MEEDQTMQVVCLEHFGLRKPSVLHFSLGKISRGGCFVALRRQLAHVSLCPAERHPSIGVERALSLFVAHWLLRMSLSAWLPLMEMQIS